MDNRPLKGKLGEEKACQFLISKGLVLLEKNYRQKTGEIDLIMRDKKHVVFIEVRTKKNTQFGGALMSVNYLKQQKIIKTALYYLTCKRLLESVAIRFDIVAFEGPQEDLRWIKNAFSDGFV